MAETPALPAPGPARRVLAAWTALLFLFWSNSFVAISYLLGSEEAPARFDWAGLTVARFLPAASVALVYVLGWRRAEAAALLRAHPGRLAACGLLGIPAYNFALYYGQQHGVPPPVAAVTTVLSPLFLLVLGARLLGERVGPRRVAGFAVAFAGILVIASAKGRVGDEPYALLVLITACAPLAWSLYTVIGKGAAARAPVLWTALTIVIGSVPLLALAPFRGGPELLELDGPGLGALAFLSFGCTVMGFAIWNWLARHLPASTVGLTVFLNPPLTTLSKAVLAAALPGSFAFRVLSREWAGGAIVLAGLALALLPGRRARM